MFTDFLQAVRTGQHLGRPEMESAVFELMTGKVSAEHIGEFLLALRDKGETTAEVAGAAAAMRRHMLPIQTNRKALVDTCGTGGDGSGTFNISTAAAIVTAASGVAVAKHGNRSFSSKTGSADVLEELGVNVDASVENAEKCLAELGICFCFAPKLHPAMKHVAPVRRSLGVPTVFNLLGPLCNPAGAPYQLLGVGKPALRTQLGAALAELGTTLAVVVHGQDGLDEITISGPTDCVEVRHQSAREFTWEPADFGLTAQPLDAALVEGSASSAEMVRNVLAGNSGVARDLVVANAAAAIWLTDTSQTLQSCATRAATAIDDGSAKRLVDEWSRLSQDDA